ncbi:MAG: AbrB/MazE/SpoVT family DNA-binding domain-containing protein, partial [Acidobacteriaceae bacterium]
RERGIRFSLLDPALTPDGALFDDQPTLTAPSVEPAVQQHQTAQFCWAALSLQLYNLDYIHADGGDMPKLKVTTVGASAGIILNKEVMALLKVKKGDSLYLTEAPGGYRITPCDPDFERQIQLAEEIMHDDRDVLKALSR